MGTRPCRAHPGPRSNALQRACRPRTTAAVDLGHAAATAGSGHRVPAWVQPCHRAATMKIDRTWIQHHIPHQGTMCLLEAVKHWNDTEIQCYARSHGALDNPLRNAHGLPISAGIEY